MWIAARIRLLAWFIPALALGQPSFDAAVKTGERMPRLHSLLASRHGEVILEHYFHGTRANSFENVKSASKSVISALVGIAIDRKLLPGVDAPIAPYFAELSAVNVDARKRMITIEDLLTMRSGLVDTNRGYGAWVQSSNWVRYLLTRPLQQQPGEPMNYNTGNTHLLSAILTKVSGGDTWSFAQNALAAPLGITLAKWPRDPQGVYFGGNDMLLTPRQMLKFGELYLHHGRSDDRQIVPSSWGFGGQYIFIVPSLDLVVVTTSSVALGDDRREYRQELFDMAEKDVIGEIGKGI
jgi:CubicO group peptidase (beta-lactamase class C family)